MQKIEALHCHSKTSTFLGTLIYNFTYEYKLQWWIYEKVHNIEMI